MSGIEQNYILQRLMGLQLRPGPVVLDIDDTTLWKDDQKGGVWKVVPAIRLFYRAVRAAGYKVVFLTARPETTENRQWTEQQLKWAGFADHDGLFMMPNITNPTASAVAQFKSKIRQKLEPSVSVGNAWQDLLHPNELPRINPYYHEHNAWMFRRPSGEVLVKFPEIYAFS